MNQSSPKGLRRASKKLLAISFVALASAVSNVYVMGEAVQIDENPYNYFFHNNRTEEEELEHYKAVNYHMGRYHHICTDGAHILSSLLLGIKENTVKPDFKKGLLDSWRSDSERKDTAGWISCCGKMSLSKNSPYGQTPMVTQEDAEEILKWLESETGISRKQIK